VEADQHPRVGLNCACQHRRQPGQGTKLTKSLEPKSRYADLIMTNRWLFHIWSTLSLLSCVFFLNCASAQAQNKGKYACDEAQPESMCNAANTCGSTSTQCTIDIRRGSYSANVKPGIPDAKNNQLFCIKAGTTVVWMSSNKNNGFMVSFGSDSPFEPDGPIMGGGKKTGNNESKRSGLLQI